MVSDHIHLLASIAAQISIAEFVNKVKGSSSYHINLITGEKGFYWQNGYGVVSLSKKGIPFVTQYIQSQKQRHRDDDLVSILEKTPMDEE